MKIKKVWQIYFSPTRTTKKVVTMLGDEISADLGTESEEYDFTLPKMRESFPDISSDELVIFGMPTYAGRVPNLMLKYLDTIEGNGALAVPVVTFGNRAFDNSLIELRNILESHRFHTIAAGAFSCEHSFSTELGAYRPDVFQRGCPPATMTALQHHLQFRFPATLRRDIISQGTGRAISSTSAR